jgi:hypothetical protein
VSAASRLRDAIDAAYPRLSAISDFEASISPSPGKWTPKQVIGHLIDSASNNHQRFVRANFTDDLIFAGYDQEKWVLLGAYADAPWNSLLSLWREFNLHRARDGCDAFLGPRHSAISPQPASGRVECGA